MPPFTTVRDTALLLRLGPTRPTAAKYSNSTSGRLRSWPLARRLRGVRNQEVVAPHLGWLTAKTASQSQRCHPAAGGRARTVRRLPMDASHGAPCPDTEAVIACLNVTDG